MFRVIWQSFCTYLKMTLSKKRGLALILCLRINLAIGQSSSSCTYTRFLPQGVEIVLHCIVFSLYRQQFLRYEPIFKIAIFGHETWPLVKVPEVAHTLYMLFLPQGVEIELIFALQAVVSEIQANFQNCHIWA